mgnify:CR=1 FL=1
MEEPLGQIIMEGVELLLLDYLGLQVIRLSGGNSPLASREYNISVRCWRVWHATFVGDTHPFAVEAEAMSILMKLDKFILFLKVHVQPCL